MKRKIIQIADSTQLISLPRKWAQKNNIQKGAEIEVIEDGTKLIILGAGGDPPLKTIKLRMNNSEEFLKRPIFTLYKLGYDEVVVDFEDSTVVALIEEELDDILGFEIVQQTKNSCTVRNVATPVDAEFNSILRRIFIIITSMAKEGLDSFQKRTYGHLSDVTRLEKTNDKLVLFCQRLLNTKGFEDHNRTTFVYNIVSHLEYIADAFCSIFHKVADAAKQDPKFSVSKDLVILFEDTNNLLTIFSELYYHYSIKKLHQFKEKHNDVEKRGFKNLTKRNDVELFMVHKILTVNEYLRNMSECVS